MPIAEDSEPVVVECHIAVDLLESVQRMRIIMSAVESSLNMRQIRHPPSFVFNLVAGFNNKLKVVTGTRTTSFGRGCALFVLIHERSGFPTTATFPWPDEN